MFEEEVPGAGLSFPFEVIATSTATANAAALAAHKLSLTPKPWADKSSSSESSPDVPGNGKDEWIPDPEISDVDDDDGSGGETDEYGVTTPSTTNRVCLQTQLPIDRKSKRDDKP